MPGTGRAPGRAIRLDAQQQAGAIAEIAGAGRLNLARAEPISGHFDLPHPPAIPPTIGQGVSGFSTLALGSMLTFVAIIAGAAATMKIQYRLA